MRVKVYENGSRFVHWRSFCFIPLCSTTIKLVSLDLTRIYLIYSLNVRHKKYEYWNRTNRQNSRLPLSGKKTSQLQIRSQLEMSNFWFRVLLQSW